MCTARSLADDGCPTRAQPPRPIFTGKGLRSAAVNDDVFTEYLESSLNVLDPTLPRANISSSSSFHSTIGAEIDLSALAAGEEFSVRTIVAAAKESGQFWIEGSAVVSSEEVKAALQAGEAVFESTAARRRGLVSRFGAGDGGGIGEEISWYRSRRKEMEPDLEDVPADTYRVFRERMEVIAAKLEMVADCLSYILCEHSLHGSREHRPPKMQSVLCLRKHRLNRFKEIPGHQSRERSGRARCLSIHLPVPSASFSAGSILVTVGEQMREWCNGEYRVSVETMRHDPGIESGTSYSMEFIVFRLKESSQDPGFRTKTVSLSTQVLALILVAVLVKMMVFN